jgi:methionyl-tRNA formyltransferase
VRPGDHGVIAGFNQIFRKPLIARFASLANFHPSLLPFYRGPVPAYWCLRHRETATGFSLHRVTAVIDSGEVLWQEVVPIQPGDEPLALTRRIAERAQEVFERYLSALRTGGPFPTRRVDACSIYRVPVDYRSFPE